jgi:hypothetical protein
MQRLWGVVDKGSEDLVVEAFKEAVEDTGIKKRDEDSQ